MKKCKILAKILAYYLIVYTLGVCLIFAGPIYIEGLLPDQLKWISVILLAYGLFTTRVIAETIASYVKKSEMNGKTETLNVKYDDVKNPRLPKYEDDTPNIEEL